MTERRYLLHGEVDLANAQQLRADLRALVQADDAHLLIDCTQLTFIDSQGIAALLEAHYSLAAAGRHMLITNVPSGSRRIFEVLGLTDLLRYEREAEAV